MRGYLELTRGCFDFSDGSNHKFKTNVTSLKIDMPYPIERAERVQTKYGEAILMTLGAESPHTFLKVFLPRRYGALFGDDDLSAINDKTITLSLK